MKRLLALDATNFSKEPLDCPGHIARLANAKVTALFLEDEATNHKRNIKEYLQHHYTKVKFQILMGIPSASILSHLSKQANCWVTFGTYGRSKFSQFFKKSKAENILSKLGMPILITHP